MKNETLFVVLLLVMFLLAYMRTEGVFTFLGSGAFNDSPTW